MRFNVHVAAFVLGSWCDCGGNYFRGWGDALNLAAWFVSLVGPVVARAIIALGFTAVSFAGVTVAMSSLVTLAQNNWSSVPTTVLQLASLSGIPEALGMIMSA